MNELMFWQIYSHTHYTHTHTHTHTLTTDFHPFLWATSAPLSIFNNWSTSSVGTCVMYDIRPGFDKISLRHWRQ